MILATREDYDYPHIDWECKECGEVYCSAGYPPETRCLDGHGAGWKPTADQLREYIAVLEGLESGDGLVICGGGPAPLMGRVKSTAVKGGGIMTEGIDSPSRVIEWEGGDDPSIRWAKYDGGETFGFRDVYHVETVEVID